MLRVFFEIFLKTRNRIKYFVFKRKFKVIKHNFKIVTLGSKYGGWSFVDDANLIESTIISCGLGEDASFDIEFANLYKANIIFVDPTPRAINHFNEIIRNLGTLKLSGYKNNGAEHADSYDLQFLIKSQLQLVEKAIWINNSPVRFYLPKDKSHVSHSIVNFQNNYSTETDYIQVKATTIKMLIEDFKLDSLPILKLDIEGAETDVVQDLLRKKIFPKQLLIEYDEMQSLDKKIKSKIYNCHLSLLEVKYKLVKVDNLNFLYVHLGQ
jgi:FkbM family methyltransferase